MQDLVLHEPTAAPAQYLGSYPVFAGNRARLLIDGGETYPAMLAAIAEAHVSVVLESYIFRDDRTGMSFRAALCDRARAGLSVRVLIDGVGSRQTPSAFWQPLLAAGGRVEVFRPLRRYLSRRWWRFLWKRDHRKLLVVDDRVAFLGGLNIADDHAPAAEGGGGWHDAHARIEGPAAYELTALFNRTWLHLTGEKNWDSRREESAAAGQTSVQILEGTMTRRHSVRKAYVHAIGAARRTIRITNAYCIPDRMVRRALRLARRRGVRVQMLLAGATDVPAVHYASRALYQRLMGWGVEVYEWTDHVLHAKTAVIDGLWCSIGSYNLDRRSLVHNLEANIACTDAALGSALEAQFERDIAASRHIDPETWHRRSPLVKLLELVFYQLRYLL